MDDKTMMASVLGNVKGMCDLMMHGTVESATPNVHATFKCALNDMLVMQNQIYAKMAQKGWYPAENAQQNEINKVKQKYANQ